MPELGLSLTVNVTSRTASIVGPDGRKVDSNGFSFFQQDEFTLKLFFQRREVIDGVSTLTTLDPSGWDVIAKVGGTTGDVLASQDTWTVQDSGANGKYLEAELSLNTSATLVAMAERVAIRRFLEIEIDDGENNFTAYQGEFTIRPEVILDGSPDATAVPSIYSAVAFGATGDGATNDTNAFAAATAAAPLKTQVYVPSGTYILDGLTITRDVGLLLHPNAVLKHKAGATADMISYTVPCTTPIEGGTFDGNKANQDVDDNWFSLLKGYSDGQQIRNVRFRNFMVSGITDFKTLGQVWYLRCQFLDGYSLSETATKANCGLNFSPGLLNGAPKVWVESCVFLNASAPSSGYKACGGAFFAGSNANSSYNSVTVKDSIFKRVGDDKVVGPNHYGIAALDLYEETWNANIEGNNIDTYYIGLKLQNVQNLYCAGNVVSTSYTCGIDYTPGERLQTGEYSTAKIIGNTVTASAEVGIYVRAGDAGGWHDAIISNNTIKNSPYGIRVNGRTGSVGSNANEGFGPLLIQGNQIWNTAGNGIDFQYTAGDFKILDNYISSTGGNGITATTAGSNTASTFTVRGNTIATATTGYRCIRFFGVKELTISDNTVSAFNGANVAIEIDQDGSANGIEKLNLGPNIIRQGTESINWAIVQKCAAKQRVIASDFTVAQNSSTTETDLCSLDIPAYTLATNGDQITFEAAGIVAASANNKRIKVYLGSTLIYDSFGFPAATTCDFSLRGTITRVNATAQNAFAEVRTGITTTATPIDYTSPTEDLATSLALRVTGQGGASSEVALGFIKARFVGVE